MTCCTHEELRPAPEGWLHAALARIAAVLRNVEARSAARRSAQSLLLMSEHDLRDIGLTRGDVETILRHPAERPDVYRGR